MRPHEPNEQITRDAEDASAGAGSRRGCGVPADRRVRAARGISALAFAAVRLRLIRNVLQ